MAQPTNLRRKTVPGLGGLLSRRADAEITKYVAQLRSLYARGYELPVGAVRGVIDGSMGSTRLTDILYESRRDDGNVI